jgi:tetratricopeptide (TPR) repeat protein
VDLEEARAAVTISDYKRGDQAAQRAAAKSKAAGASLLQAKALLWEGWAASYLGDNARAISKLDEARGLCEPLSDHACVARSMDWAGTVYSDQGDYPRASERLQAAVALAKSCGDGNTEMGALNNLALVESAQGHLTVATELLDQALAIATRLVDRRSQAMMTDSKAGILAALAQPDAERFEESVLKEFVAQGDQGSAAMARMMLGKIALDRGDLARSRETLEASLKTLQELKMQIGVVNALQALATVREERDEAGEAKRLLDEEVRVASLLGASAALANAQVAEARLLSAGGKPAEAVKAAAEAVGALHERHALDDEVAARLLEAGALRASHQFVEAQQVLDAAQPIADASENPRSRLGWRIESAVLQASTGYAPQAEEVIAQAVADARQVGLVRLEYEARLAQAEIEILAGHRKKGVSQLQVLSKDASARGLQRVARLANALGRE